MSKPFATNGAQVILANIVPNKLGSNKASEIGSNAHYRHYDVTKEEDIASTMDFNVKKFRKLDIMCNNTRVKTPQEEFQNFDVDMYDRHNSIIVKGVIASIKHASQAMIPMKQGIILNTGNVASMFTGKHMPLGYNMCKSNLPGMMKIVAYHLGKHGIRVNAISPHGIVNPMIVQWLNKLGVNVIFEETKQAFIVASPLLGKRTTEADIAKGALFLCSDDSGFVNGQNLIVDGGWCNSK